MERELLKELNEIRRELEIPAEDFFLILAKAKMRRDKSKIHISDEMLYEIILDSLSSYDYDQEAEKKNYTIDALKTLIADEKKQRHLPDDVLFAIIEDSLDILQENEYQKKTNGEIVERAAKSLGF